MNLPETGAWPAVLAEGHTVLTDANGGSPAERVERDRALGERVAASGGPATYRIWTNQRCIVATRREARLPSYRAAADASGARGWPLVLRDSGGTAIPHLEDTLQFTLALPRRAQEEPSIESVYRALGAPIKAALEKLGYRAAFGEVPRSFCDGRFNLVVDGRKVAGSAQRWAGGVPGSRGKSGYILAHLSLWVGGDLVEATEAVNRFLEEAGGSGGFDPHAVSSLNALAPGPATGLGDLADLRAVLQDELQQSAGG